MIVFYSMQKDGLKPISLDEARAAPRQLIWVDMFVPDADEEKAVEALLNADIPTREEMNKLEPSYRLYMENRALYATATLVAHAESGPETHAVTFMLLEAWPCLVTVRYVESTPFNTFLNRAQRGCKADCQGNTVFAILLELIVERLAHLLEETGHKLDHTTSSIFKAKLRNKAANFAEKLDFEALLQEIGLEGDLISRTRESLLSISRLISFISHTPYFKPASDEHGRIVALLQDIPALSDHANFLSNRVNFLLNTTMGMISIEQNTVIKIFSIAAVMFLPPTLIASMYGMNFQFMPELGWQGGYPLAIALMLISSYIPYRFFKRKGWL